MREASYYKFIIFINNSNNIKLVSTINKENYDLRDPDKDNRGI